MFLTETEKYEEKNINKCNLVRNLLILNSHPEKNPSYKDVKKKKSQLRK